MKARAIALLGAALTVMVMGAPTASAASLGSVSAKQPGTDPLRDAVAAGRVNQTSWEPRGENAQENRRRPDDGQLRDFRHRSYMVNRHEVTGRYRGTTDEILQWAARKWGFDPDLFRAVAYVESSWKMSTVGDGGLSFGLFQMKKTYHCCLPLSSKYSAFNADYYGAILRAYYDGRETWLNDVERGARYHAGDLWGSVGSWFAGRWRTAPALDYIGKVQRALRDEPWREPWF
jgi:hypothetical protein